MTARVTTEDALFFARQRAEREQKDMHCWFREGGTYYVRSHEEGRPHVCAEEFAVVTYNRDDRTTTTKFCGMMPGQYD